MIPHVLSIAGSDPSGGAGVQADLKTFSALGCYGMTVITALTAQNTQGVTAIHEIPHAFVAQQIDALFSDIRIDAVKIGMVGSAKTTEIIASALQRHKPGYIVFDPVMAAQSGDLLIGEQAVKALKQYLVPLADVITPNIPEAGILLGADFNSEDMKFSAQKILGLEARAVLLKGGHEDGTDCNDVYVDRNQSLVLKQPRIQTRNNHGTGCTLSAAIAAHLAKGLPVAQACQAAKKYITNALRHADELSVGEGHGPVHHFYAQWD